MTPADALAAEAARYLGTVETPRGSNRGTAIDYWIAETGLDPAGAFPWCQAFMYQVGRQAVGRAWPCPRTASVQKVVDWATKAGCLERTPEKGDLFARWFPALKRYAHIGVVESVDPVSGKIVTIEGNTNLGGSREGYGVFRRPAWRPSEGVIFVRWTKAMGA